MKEITLEIEGLHCDHCTALVKKSLEIVSGVKSAKVTIKTAHIVYDEDITVKDELIMAVTRFGYKATLKPELSVNG